MASKTVTLALAVIIVAVLVFLILWFLNTRKQTQETEHHHHHYVSPLSTIEHDVSHFVNGVRRGFTDVLSAGERLAGKFLGWGEKELSNIVGVIEHGASSVERGAETFVKDVYNTIGLGGIIKVFGGGAEKVAGEIEKGVENIGKIRPPIEILPPIENIPKEVYGGVEQVGKYIPEIPSDIEKGAEGFVNEIKSILKRL